MTSNDNDEPDTFPWHSLMRDFELTDTRIVATLGPDRGALVETPPSLVCSEGRYHTIEMRGDNAPLEQLEYSFNFATHDEAEPYPSQSVVARIVLEGTTENGVRVEVRGDGWIGYDEIGRIEGRFDEPPIVIAHPARDEDGKSPKNRRKKHSPDFDMPEQFEWANLAVPLDDDEDRAVIFQK